MGGEKPKGKLSEKTHKKLSIVWQFKYFFFVNFASLQTDVFFPETIPSLLQLLQNDSCCTRSFIDGVTDVSCLSFSFFLFHIVFPLIFFSQIEIRLKFPGGLS